MSEAIIAKKAELVDVVAEKMKAAASIVVVDPSFPLTNPAFSIENFPFFFFLIFYALPLQHQKVNFYYNE